MRRQTWLSDYLSLDAPKGTQIKIVIQDREIDLLYDDGIYFKLVISGDHNDCLRMLLEEYSLRHFLDSSSLAWESVLARFRLRTVLQDAIDTYGLRSPEMREILRPFLSSCNHSCSTSVEVQEAETLADRKNEADDGTFMSWLSCSTVEEFLAEWPLVISDILAEYVDPELLQ
jgi:hypothetical protein